MKELHSSEHWMRRTSHLNGTADKKKLQGSLKQRVEDHHRTLQHKMERTSQINWKRLGNTS